MKTKMKKVTIIGSGNVGTNAAASIFRTCSCEIVLLDVREGWAEGRALDIRQSGKSDRNPFPTQRNIVLR